MGIWQEFKAAFSPKKATPTEEGAAFLAQVLPYGQAPRRGSKELLLTYKRLPYLHALLRRIAEDTAAVPWVVYATGKRGARAKSVLRAPPSERSSLIRRAVKQGELAELDSHPFLEVLEGMSPYLGGHDSWTLASIYNDLLGNAPLLRINNQLGQPLELHPINPTWIAETPSAGRPYYRASYGSWQRIIPTEELVWLKSPDPEQPYGLGSSYGSAMADELDVSELLGRYVKNYLHNDATPQAIVKVGAPNPAEQARIQERFDAGHRGPKKGRVFVTSGDVGYQRLEQTWQEMNMGTMREDARSFVQQVLQFPPELMGVLDQSNRSTIDAAYYLYATGCLVPRKERQRAAMQRLLDEYGPGLVLGYVSPVPEDEAAQREYMKAVPAAFTLNEHRSVGGQPAREDGDELFTPPAAPSPLGFSVGREPEWTKALPQPVQRASTSAALDALRPEVLADELGPVQEGGFEDWANEALRELGLSPSFNMRNPLVRQALEQRAAERVRLVTDTTRAALREELAAGVAAGEGINLLRKRVEEVFSEAEGYRAERIARTEVVGLSNAANVEAWRQSGVVEGKEWLAVRDGNTRDEHRALDGQVVSGVDGMFSVAGYRASHPGGFGVASMDISCRCTTLPKVVDPQKAMDEVSKAARWKKYDEALVPWEKRLEAALRRGFQKQRAAVLTALGG
jgi:SPP1 gp7 family putative phage head morphogenesis protein